MKTYVCKLCGYSGIRSAVRKHLREDHLINKKGIGIISNNYYSIDSEGNYLEYNKDKKNSKPITKKDFKRLE